MPLGDPPVTIGEKDVLVVVDVQNDFCPGGALEVPKGDEVVPVINRLIARIPDVLLTQDWHPRGHQSFASSHPGSKPFETIEVDYGTQILWPDHCVQGSEGAAFHPDLETTGAELVIRKGFHQEIDSYSAFYENDQKTPTGLTGYLQTRGFERVFLCGLAMDICVHYSAMDARREGFTAVLIEDACRAIDMDGSLAAARKGWDMAGVEVINSDALGV